MKKGKSDLKRQATINMMEYKELFNINECTKELLTDIINDQTGRKSKPARYLDFLRTQRSQDIHLEIKTGHNKQSVMKSSEGTPNVFSMLRLKKAKRKAERIQRSSETPNMENAVPAIHLANPSMKRLKDKLSQHRRS